MTPLWPYDLHRLENGTAPEAVFDEIEEEEATDSSLLLFHPNILASYDSLPAFGSWIAKRELRTPDDHVAEKGGAPGLLLDVFPPFTIS